MHVIIFMFQAGERKIKHPVLKSSEERYAVYMNLSDYGGLKQSPTVRSVSKVMNLGVPKNKILP
jgi:hypothetical protein